MQEICKDKRASGCQKQVVSALAGEGRVKGVDSGPLHVGRKVEPDELAVGPHGQGMTGQVRKLSCRIYHQLEKFAAAMPGCGPCIVDFRRGERGGGGMD